jgi:hypothetical protein
MARKKNLGKSPWNNQLNYDGILIESYSKTWIRIRKLLWLKIIDKLQINVLIVNYSFDRRLPVVTVIWADQEPPASKIARLFCTVWVLTCVLTENINIQIVKMFEFFC